MPSGLFAAFAFLPTFALVAGRIGGVALFLPAIGGMSVPVQIRALLVAALAAIVAPVVGGPAAMPASSIDLGMALVAEFGLGACVGLAIRMAFSGLQLGGLLIAQDAGLAYGQIVDPTNGFESDTLSMFYLQLGLLVFLFAGGLHEIVMATLRSFQSVPLLEAARLGEDGLELVLAALSAGLELGVRIAAPTLLTLLLANTALGFIARTVPQLNVAMVGFSAKGLIALTVMAATLPIAMNSFNSTLDTTVEWITQWLETA